METTVQQITPAELKIRMTNDQIILLDVRDYNEWIFCRITGAELIPLHKIYNVRIPVEDNKEIVLYCHTGHRSYFAAQVLQQRGFQKVFNLLGGIDAYAQEVDPSIPRY
ncbi:MAG TPA: rhodanese-like domain-containing protein [bacterium]|nr:rhodanese-like domain-containing protein [bacterium]